MSFFDRAAVMPVPGVYAFTPETWEGAYRDRISSLAHSITPSVAEGVPIAYICTRVVSEDIAKVSLHVYEDLGIDGEGRSRGKRKATEHEWYDALHHQANEFQSAIDFREMMTAFALNRGRGVAKKVKRRVGGTVRRELEPLHPELVTRERTDTGAERYFYSNPVTNKRETLLADEVLVLWGPRRKSVITYLRELLAIMAAGQQTKGQMLARGPRHTGVITRPKDAPKWSDKARENFRDAVDEYMGEGERAGRPLLLEDGMDWISTSFSLKDTEFVAGSQLDNALVCGAYRVPQHKAGLLERSTNNNIQQQATDYVVDCLLAWAVRWEQAIRMSLLIDPFKAEHNLRSLLRGDPKTAAETAQIYGNLGWLAGNEARDDEGRNPIDGLWEPRVPLNQTSATSAAASADAAPPEQGPVDLHHRALIRDGAARVVRKEAQTLGKLRDQYAGDAWAKEVRDFYRDHAEFVAKVLRVDDERAAAYCAARCQAVVSNPLALDDLEDTGISQLTSMTLSAEGAAA